MKCPICIVGGLSYFENVVNILSSLETIKFIKINCQSICHQYDNRILHPVQAIHSVAWHHEGKQFICSHSDGTLTIWNVRSPAKPVQTITPHGKDASMLKTTQRQIMLLIVRDSAVNVYVTMSLKHQSPRVCGSQGLSKHIASSCLFVTSRECEAGQLLQCSQSLGREVPTGLTVSP